MDNIQAINKRISQRSYDGSTLTQSEMLELNTMIQQYNKEANMTSFIIDDASVAFDSFKKSYGIFKNVKSLIVLKGKKIDTNLKEKSGYYGQKLVIRATQLDLGTCWIGASCDMKSPIFNINEDEKCYCVISIGKAISSKAFNEKLMLKVLHRKEKPLSHFYNADINENEFPDYFMIGCKAVAKSPTAINSQKVYLKLENAVISIHVPDKANLDMVDLGIAKANFELATDLKFPLGNNAVLNVN